MCVWGGGGGGAAGDVCQVVVTWISRDHRHLLNQRRRRSGGVERGVRELPFISSHSRSPAL